MEPRRLILAVILMAAVLFVTPILFPNKVPPELARKATADSLARIASADSASRALTASGTPAATGSAAANAAAGVSGQTAVLNVPDSATAAIGAVPVDTTAVETQRAVYRTTNRGAAFIGAEMRDYLYGMRDYISLAEADRIRVLQAPGTAERIDVTDESAVIKLYEKLLPYAMIFGLEKEWIGELSHYYSETQQPEWYTGGNNFSSVGAFAGAVGTRSFATTAPSTTSGSSWSSSGGSSSFGGSSGGGHSGGGSGGGGGGRW